MGCLEFKWIVMDKIVIMGMSGWCGLEDKIFGGEKNQGRIIYVDIEITKNMGEYWREWQLAKKNI